MKGNTMIEKQSLAVLDFIAKAEHERESKGIIPHNVPYIEVSRGVGELVRLNLDYILESLCSLGRLEKHEMINGYSYSIKK